ncbi:MAG: hypothetical protein HQL24_01250 [Candidatus Omnitrophica bacterium]|nr:hypothetical protein [Candidatus Omnitrophota bacterium]
MININNKKVTVIGGQKSGIALLKLIDQLGGKPRLSEKGVSPYLTPELRAWISKEQIAVEENGHTQKFVEDSDFVVLSPGVRFDSDVVTWAKNKNICVLGEIEFAYQFCSKPVIAVTGSNGKTTVSTLIHKVLERSGFSSCLCGNVGSPFSEHVLESDTLDYFVLEISSFQLESLFPVGSPYERVGLKGFKPFVSVFINFNQNHLDRHKDLDEYFEAKTKIFQNQDKNDFAVLNFKDERVKALAPRLPSKVVFFDGEAPNPNHAVVRKVAESFHIPDGVCEDVFKNFKGVEHRMELVRTLNGVDYINDSKATTAQSGRWALNLLDKPVIMICGGSSKNIDYTPLRDLVRRKVKKMIAIGVIKEQLMETFKDVIAVEAAQTFQEAVERAKEEAVSGDCVLLSPMTASFDMFKNFEERGRVFKEIVLSL